MPANPKAGKALLRRLPMEERFGMAQFSHVLGHTELNWRDEIRPSWFQVKTNDGGGGYADPGGGQVSGQARSRPTSGLPLGADMAAAG